MYSNESDPGNTESKPPSTGVYLFCRINDITRDACPCVMILRKEAFMLTIYKTTEQGLEQLKSMANGSWIKAIDPTPMRSNDLSI